MGAAIITILPSQGCSAVGSSLGNSLIPSYFFLSLSLKSGRRTPPKSVKWLWCPTVRREGKIRHWNNWCWSQPAILGTQWGSLQYKLMLFSLSYFFFLLERKAWFLRHDFNGDILSDELVSCCLKSQGRAQPQDRDRAGLWHRDGEFLRRTECGQQEQVDTQPRK